MQIEIMSYEKISNGKAHLMKCKFEPLQTLGL